MARIKYFNQTTRTWEYADLAYAVQSSGQNSALLAPTVANMKTMTDLVEGDIVTTQGYHTVHDGGGADYIITATVDSAEHQETLSNGLYATLLHGDIINVLQLGAIRYDSVWSATQDASVAIQKAIDIATGGIYIPAGAYKIKKTVLVSGKNHFTIDAENADIWFEQYSDETAYCFKCTASSYCTFKLGTIRANKGGCVEFYSDSNSTKVMYINTTFRQFQSNSNCVYVHLTGGYVCELRFYKGRVMRYSGSSGGTGFKIVGADTCRTDHYVFQNIGIEGVETGFHFVGVEESTLSTTGFVETCELTNCRFHESFTTLLKTEGHVRYVKITGSALIYAKYFDLSKKTDYCTIYASCVDDGGGWRGDVCRISKGELVMDDAKFLIYKNSAELDLSTFDPMQIASVGCIYIESGVEKLKLNAQFGFLKKMKFMIVAVGKHDNFAIYDDSDTIICDCSNINAGDVVEVKMLPDTVTNNIENVWIATKIGTLPTS